jgi:hypothetical protein
MVNLTADEEKGFWSRSSVNELKGAASYFIIVAPVPKWDGVEKLIDRSVTGNDFLAFRHELAYNVINLFENEAKYSAFQPISA